MRWLVACLALVAFAGCESTQAKSARLERQAQAAKTEKGVVVTRDAPEIEVGEAAVLQDANGAATAVELRNKSGAPLVGLPISVSVLDAAKKPVYTNDTPGLDASLVSVPALAGGERLVWVNDQVTLAGEGKEVTARVGTGGKPGPPELPEMEITGLKVTTDVGGSATGVGTVHNRSDVLQRRLVVFVAARKADRVVAAGRAIVEQLPAGKSANFTAFLIGDAAGAELSAAAPPTIVTP
ncbi:hypothetical protein DVA67_028980 [Solirubrobacter sp. CPCC 204708]|uniref:Lipoprotein n=1 Tax=Solirubrobacter deserti TaxID=2282478 RepID=A0ABT4RTR8_9ACTN|nr:hypothetical protein [Solirubrobacter deserti]MBE2320034.1 hypothetical protein [Solirubrobacter deserti]MDA0141978.1 hypothetical protein [Solirubrobacter deserti]